VDASVAAKPPRLPFGSDAADAVQGIRSVNLTLPTSWVAAT